MDRCCIESIAMMSQKKLYVHPYLSEAVSHNNSKTFTTYINSLKKWFLILIIIISHSHQSRKKFRKIETHILMHPITSYLFYLCLPICLWYVCQLDLRQKSAENWQTGEATPHFTRKHYDVWVQERARAAPSFQKWQWCHVAQIVCYDLFFNNRPIRVGTLYLKFKKEREFQNFSVIKNEMRKEIY